MTPRIVVVNGGGSDASTWVVEVCFTQVPDLTHVNQLLAFMGDRQLQFGIAQVDTNRFLMVCTSHTSVVSSSCKTTLTRICRNAGIQVQIGQIVALNQYHLELFGISPPPTYNEEEPEEGLNEDDQAELGESYGEANTKAEIDRIWTEYSKKLNQSALALREITKPKQGITLQWITEMPERLEVVSKRKLAEWQKLEWVLLRNKAFYGDDYLRTNPTPEHWEQFYKLYYDISPVGEPRKRRAQAFATFAGHVKAVTGMVVTKADLQKSGQKVLRNGFCFKCDKDIPTMEDVEGQFYTNVGTVVSRDVFEKKVVRDESVYGIFCSKRCANGTCLGCAGGLVDGKCTSIWCGHDQKRNQREALPLGYGVDGYDEYIGEVETKFAKMNLPLDWPMCKAKRQCFWHGCNHVCERDCTHECTVKCRKHKTTMKGEEIPFGHLLCSCEPEWYGSEEPDSKRQRK